MRLPIEEEVPKSIIIQPHLSVSTVTKKTTDEFENIFEKTEVDVSDIKIKELYDYVYDDSTTDSLDDLFATKIETPNVSTEIDKHHVMIQDTQVVSINAHLCDYEVIGDLTEKTDYSISGIDMTCQTFSKTI